MNAKTQVEFADRTLSVTNLDKVLYPESGFTKGDLIDYYAKISPVLLPHMKGRCITTRRWPNGIEEDNFFQKNCPDHRPGWIETAPGPKHSSPVNYCLVSEQAAIVWLANLAAIEIHLPMALARDVSEPRSVVFDLDPGPGCTLEHCSIVALEIRDTLEALDLASVVKTSGQKGMGVYVPIAKGAGHEQAAQFAKAIGGLVAERTENLVTLDMAKAERTNKVFIDWSQNALHKTTISVYSLRPTENPHVSTPVSWDEVSVQAGTAEQLLIFSPNDVLERVETFGDLFEQNLGSDQELPVL